MASGFHNQSLEPIVLSKVFERKSTRGVQIPFHFIHDPGQPVLVDFEDSERIHLDMYSGESRTYIDIYDMANHGKFQFFSELTQILAIDFGVLITP